MKIAITASSQTITAQFDERFGRCPYFIIIDTDTRDWEAHPNPAVDELGGAGTLAAQFISNLSVGAVISGKFGPKAASALQAAGVQLLESRSGTVEAVYEKYLTGELTNNPTILRSGKHAGKGRHSRRSGQ